MKTHQNKFTEIMLTFLLSQICTVWKKKNSMTTLLLFNMFEMFFRILQEQLTHIMKRKKVFKWLINWISFFMLNKKITLIFNDQKFRVFDILMRISQNLSLLSILFLFYNVKFLKIYNSIKVEISSLTFVNDINFLVYESKKTVNN